MKNYVVKLKGKLFNNCLLIEAENFEINLFNTITFKDDKGDNVALFNKADIKYIKTLLNEQE